MIQFTKEELLKIAELSLLKLDDHELDTFVGQLQQILNYTRELANVDTSREQEPIRTVNVFREDKAIKKDPDALLANAPQSEEQYFVLPQILSGNKNSEPSL